MTATILFWDGFLDDANDSGPFDQSYVEIYIDLENEKCVVRPSGANPIKSNTYTLSEWDGEAISFAPHIVFLDKSEVERFRSELHKWCDLFDEEYIENGEVSFETIRDFEKDCESWEEDSSYNEMKVFEKLAEEVNSKLSDKDLDELAKDVIEDIGKDVDIDLDIEEFRQNFQDRLDALLDDRGILNSTYFAVVVMIDDCDKIDELLKKHHDEMFPEEDDEEENEEDDE